MPSFTSIVSLTFDVLGLQLSQEENLWSIFIRGATPTATGRWSRIMSMGSCDDK
ncbi:hypothetical protein ACBC55_04920 [Klebsiella spallanzanii]|uniref:hypothetical protein n=1 Tax=Klebsiella spallanzanii TaxID=2587528 RepID=UPI0015D5B312|nr:hypothetical protein [Klebsiella spallanzanii]